jgi:hypothetical protein
MLGGYSLGTVSLGDLLKRLFVRTVRSIILYQKKRSFEVSLKGQDITLYQKNRSYTLYLSC